MNHTVLTKTLAALALLALMATELQAAPSDVDDLVGARASSGESALMRRGYEYRKTIKVSSNSIAYWWNPQAGSCLAVTTANGRYKSIATQPEAVCRAEGSEAPPGGYGRPTPQVMRVDNGNISVDMGGCTVLFRPNGSVVTQGSSCTRDDLQDARFAFDSYRREQGAPASAEAPPGGYGGQNATATVTCESANYGYQFCRQPIGAYAKVRLQRRLSGAHCVQGESWGYDADGVWVDKGCAAVFEIR